MQLGAYVVEGEVGRGGMGVVYRARRADGTLVAIKVLRTHDADAVSRFERERRLLGALGEPEGFVPLSDWGMERGMPFIVMPFVTGGTLRARLGRGPLPVAETLDLLGALARALGTAHGRGIVHRDLKPENILFTADGRPLVADLGLAKHFDRGAPGASQSVSLSADGTFRGTAAYMSPEQMHEPKTVGPPADVFALGAILHECLAGTPAFEGSSLLAVVARIEDGDRTPLDRTDVPHWLVAVLDRALAHDARERFADGWALGRALDSEPKLAARRRRLARGLAAGALALALAAALGAARILTSSAGPPSTHGEPPSPPPPPPPAPDPWPAAFRPFARGSHVALTAVMGRTAFAHSLRIGRIVFAPRGDTIASGCDDGTVRLWDAASGAERAELPIGARVGGLAWSPDGALVVASDGDGTIDVFDARSHERRHRIATVPGGANVLGFTAAGELVAFGTADSVRIIDATKGTVVSSAPRPASCDGPPTIAASGERAAASSRSGDVTVWETRTGKVLKVVKGTEAFVNVALDPAGEKVLVSRGGSLVLHDVDGPGSVELGRDFQMAPALAISPTGSRALLADMTGSVKLLELAPGGLVLQLDAGQLPVASVAFSKDGARVAWARFSRVSVRDTATGATHTGDPAPVQLAVSPDEKRVAAPCLDGTVRIFDLASGAVPRTLVHGGFPSFVFWRGDDELISTATDGSLRIWDATTGREKRRAPPTGKAYAFANAVAPDGSTLLWGDVQGLVSTQELSGDARPLIATGRSRIKALAATPDEVVACTEEGTLVTIDPRAQPPTQRRVELGTHVEQAAFSADGSLVLVGDHDIALAGRDGRVQVLGTLPDAISTLALAPDGSLALGASLSGLVVLWDAKTGKELDRLSLESTHDLVQSARFRHGGLLLGTARGLVLRYEVRAGASR